MSRYLTTVWGLGRRIASRRDELNLRREELARRADVPLAYLRYLEEQTVESMRDTVARIADALDMTIDELIGEAADVPSGSGEAGPHPTMVHLDEAESMRLLTAGGVGRIGFTGSSGPLVLPVNFQILDDDIVFRTATGGEIDAELHAGPVESAHTVAFEVDRMEELTRSGWSVLVQGSLRHLTDDEHAAAVASAVEPWVGGERHEYLGITPERVSGRRIMAGG
ncbi:helix-turn-helix domain-containing protein [Nonomuraea sp. NN258]|uniref:helix-turn-helix domain-containing protein n=1 Tax=Nonomuraea antri TaxID=2730852 RepID=UPI0015681DFB|nr:pyridoxamine 5'-phosphate oxidase family protein [Nonomuraea antri]NRQ39065.1 helix-turn-helix domain-containing protein [Nonomuraea antri]